MAFVQQFSSRQDAIELLILPALDDFVDDFDVEAIADEVLDYQDGGFTFVVDEEEFVESIKRHDLSA